MPPRGRPARIRTSSSSQPRCRRWFSSCGPRAEPARGFREETPGSGRRKPGVPLPPRKVRACFLFCRRLFDGPSEGLPSVFLPQRGWIFLQHPRFPARDQGRVSSSRPQRTHPRPKAQRPPPPAGWGGFSLWFPRRAALGCGRIPPRLKINLHLHHQLLLAGQNLQQFLILFHSPLRRRLGCPLGGRCLGR